MMEAATHQFPVFVFPHNLKFFMNSRQSHKQILTIYNPYEFPIRFKVLSTAPTKYSVVDPDGNIGPHACVDILIRHTMPVLSNCNALDKFRIYLQDHVTKKVLGKRDVESTLLPSEVMENLQSEVEKRPEELRPGNEFPAMHSYRGLGYQQNNNTVIYISGLMLIMCSLALLWPTQQDPVVESKVIPKYLYISNTVKLVFAYVLGIVTMVILKS